jgi:hypothetical protein
MFEFLLVKPCRCEVSGFLKTKNHGNVKSISGRSEIQR